MIKNIFWIGFALLFAGCAPFKQRFTEPHSVDFAAVSAAAALAAAAYEDDAAVAAACRKQGYSQVFVAAIPATDDRYFLATDTATHRHVISVRGTSNVKNIRTDVSYDKTKDDVLGISLHRGFRAAARRLYDEVLPRMDKTYAVRVTGHSLGGAEAVLLGMYFQAEGWNVAGVTTFGQPKVTDKAGARKKSGLPLLRVVNVNDPVPMVPPREVKYIKKPYRHLGREVLLLDGPYYSYLENGNEADPQNLAFWNSLDTLDTFQKNLPQHSMATYLSRLALKKAGAQEVPYDEHLKHFTADPPPLNP